MNNKTTLVLLLIFSVLILSGCDIQMTYYPSVKSDTKNLYYTLEYDFFPEQIQTLDKTAKIPFPLLDTEQNAYIVHVDTNLPYYRDDKNAINSELPYFYDLEKIKREGKYQKIKQLTVTYQLDARLLNELPKDLQYPENNLPEQVKPYLTLDPSDKSAASLAASLVASLPPQDKNNLRAVYQLYAQWILNNINYPVSFKEYSQSFSGARNTAQLLKNKVGISEDISQLLVVMFRSQGIPARVLTGLDGVLVERKSDPRKPADLKLLEDGFHTQVEVFADGKWYLLDPCLFPTVKSNVTNIRLTTGQLLSVYKSDSTYKRKPLMPMGYMIINAGARHVNSPQQNDLNSLTPSSVYLN